ALRLREVHAAPFLFLNSSRMGGFQAGTGCTPARIFWRQHSGPTLFVLPATSLARPYKAQKSISWLSTFRDSLDIPFRKLSFSVDTGGTRSSYVTTGLQQMLLLN